MANTTASASGANRYRATPVKKEHRHEHDADAQRRYQRRNGDFPGTVQNGLVQIRPQMNMALDVLDGHGRIVDQDADRERKAAQGHDVQRLARRCTGR